MSGRAPSPPLNYDYSVVKTDTDPAEILLLDDKNEYHKQLGNHIRQPIFNLMKSIYNSAENICHQENTPENILMVFQDNLAQVPKWNKPRRTKEYDEFMKVSKCDWFNELIKFTYVTHVKILTIVNKPRPNVKLSISIPSGDAFFHSVCINIARELWRQPYLFSKHVGGKYEYQKNMRLIEQLIDNSVDNTIRAHIPMKTIFEDYLDNNLALDNTQSQQSPSNTNSKSPDSHETNTPKLDKQPDTPDPKPANQASKSLPPSQINTAESLDEFIAAPVEKSANKPASQPTLEPPNPVTNDNQTFDEFTDLEPVSFAKPDEMEEELEIIEPPIEETAISLETEVIPELSEVIIQTPAEKPISNTTGTDNNAALNDPPRIEEFNIDSLPEISLDPISVRASADDNNRGANNELTNTDSKLAETQTLAQTPTLAQTLKPALTDLNEPGMNLLPELKQPVMKKKIIIEDLPVDDLDEINLNSKLEEQRTTKYSTTNTGSIGNTQQQMHTKNIKQDYAFF